MVIYLRHPIHGSKVATSDLEAKADAANGWVRSDPEPAPVAEPAEPTEPVANALTERRKPGPKPKIKE